MSKRTPVTEVVKDAVTFQRERLGEPRPIDPDAFDRWLAQVKAEALREAAEDVADLDPRDAVQWLRYRADQIERDHQ